MGSVREEIVRFESKPWGHSKERPLEGKPMWGRTGAVGLKASTFSRRDTPEGVNHTKVQHTRP